MADFELRLQFRISGGNSGIQVRSHEKNNHLVGYQIHSLYKPSEVLVCEEILLVEGVYWNDIHIRMHHAVDMQFAATGEQTWSCSFQHLHPGRSVRSRTLTLPQ